MIYPSVGPLDKIVNRPLPCLDHTDDQPRPPMTIRHRRTPCAITKTMKSLELLVKRLPLSVPAHPLDEGAHLRPQSKRILLDRDGHALEPVDRRATLASMVRVNLSSSCAVATAPGGPFIAVCKSTSVVADGDVTSATILLRHLPVAAGTLFTCMRVPSVWFMLMSGSPLL